MIVWVMQLMHHCILQNFRDNNSVYIARDEITGTSIETVSRYEQMNKYAWICLVTRDRIFYVGKEVSTRTKSRRFMARLLSKNVNTFWGYVDLLSRLTFRIFRFLPWLIVSWWKLNIVGCKRIPLLILETRSGRRKKNTIVRISTWVSITIEIFRI